LEKKSVFLTLRPSPPRGKLPRCKVAALDRLKRLKVLDTLRKRLEYLGIVLRHSGDFFISRDKCVIFGGKSGDDFNPYYDTQP
jgi:hypothetical protein